MDKPPSDKRKKINKDAPGTSTDTSINIPDKTFLDWNEASYNYEQEFLSRSQCGGSESPSYISHSEEVSG